MSTQKQQKQSKLDQLRDRQQQAEAGGGAARVEKQHAAGKMTARERVAFLLDDGARALGLSVFPAGPGNTEMQADAIAHLRPAGYTGVVPGRSR